MVGDDAMECLIVTGNLIYSQLKRIIKKNQSTVFYADTSLAETTSEKLSVAIFLTKSQVSYVKHLI